MAWVKVPLPKQIYKSADEQQLPSQLGARLVNAYIDELGHIKKRSGLTEVVDLGSSSKVHGLFWWDAKSMAIAVSNGNIYKITSATGNFADMAGDDLAPTTRVTFAEDGTKLVMANSSNMVVFDGTNPPADMADGDAPTAVNNVTWLDGYLLADDTANIGRVAFSSPTNIESWAASDIFTAETRPDAIQFMDQRWRELTIFGKDTIDVYYDDGATPFTRLDGAYSEIGCIAKDSVQFNEGVWTWLDSNRRVSQLAGRQHRPVSTPFDDDIRDITPVSSAEAIQINEGVRRFYILTFPDEDRSVTYDQSTQGWSEWGEWDSTNYVFKRFIGTTATYAKAWDLILVGDKSNGKVYRVDSSSFLDDGDNIRTLIRTGHIDHGTSNRKRSHEVRLRVKRGTGGVTTNPTFSTRWRDNNGAWSNWHSRYLGTAGDTNFYVNFRRMGIYRTRQWEFQHSDDSDFILIEMQENVEDLGR